MEIYIKKILCSIIIFLFLMNFYTINSYAIDTMVISTVASATESTGSDAIKGFISEAENQKDSKTVKSTKNIMGAVRAVMQVVSIGVAVVMLTILAIKYMVSSVNDRAEIKKHAVIYVVGAIIIFSVNGIILIIQSFTKNITY